MNFIRNLPWGAWAAIAAASWTAGWMLRPGHEREASPIVAFLSFVLKVFAGVAVVMAIVVYGRWAVHTSH